MIPTRIAMQMTSLFWTSAANAFGSSSPRGGRG
jgi:hypothetical protein